MSKTLWKSGTMIYPVPAVMVSCGELGSGPEKNKINIITISWTGTICSEPAMASISVRPSRYSHELITKCGEFVINLTTTKLAFAADYCGVKSGRDIDKFEKMKLTPLKGRHVKAPLIGESPVNIECEVTGIKKLGSHDMFIAKILCIHADEKYIDDKGAFDLRAAGPLCYCHGKYYALGKYIGRFGFSVRKK